MFFELDDIRRRRLPTWTLNNVTGWHTAVDSTPSWNYQRGTQNFNDRHHGWSHHFILPAVHQSLHSKLDSALQVLRTPNISQSSTNLVQLSHKSRVLQQGSQRCSPPGSLRSFLRHGSQAGCFQAVQLWLAKQLRRFRVQLLS